MIGALESLSFTVFKARLFENDVPIKTVQILLSHGDIKMTADIYTHVMPEQKIRVKDNFNSLFAI